MANYTVIPKDLDITSLPDNKTLALDDDEKISFSKPYYNIFNELILKNLINSYENNLSDLTYDFAQADSFHIENGINATVNTTTNFTYENNSYNNKTDEEITIESTTPNESFDINYDVLIKKDYIYLKTFYIQVRFGGTDNYTVTITDSQNNIIGQKSLTTTSGDFSIEMQPSDYSRVLIANETVNVKITGADKYWVTSNQTFENDHVSITGQINCKYSDTTLVNALITKLGFYDNASLNVSVSDVNDTDSVALFIDSDKPNLITPTYNTSGGELNSIDFDFSGTEAINFYGYVLYVYK